MPRLSTYSIAGANVPVLFHATSRKSATAVLPCSADRNENAIEPGTSKNMREKSWACLALTSSESVAFRRRPFRLNRAMFATSGGRWGPHRNAAGPTGSGQDCDQELKSWGFYHEKVLAGRGCPLCIGGSRGRR